jgi:hypothetical protein
VLDQSRRRLPDVPLPTSQPQGAVKARYPIGDRQHRDVLAEIVGSLQRTISAVGRESPASAVQTGLARLRSPEPQGRPLDIHIRLATTELEVEVEVVPSGTVREPVSADRRDFRTWLLTRLHEVGLSQESAARRIGVSARTVGRWARGETQPRMRDLGRVREVLGDLPSF